MSEPVVVAASADVLDLGGSVGVWLQRADGERIGARLSVEAAIELQAELQRAILDAMTARMLSLEQRSERR